MLYEKVEISPPAELLACATRPAGFGAKAWAVMPADVRAKLVEIMGAFRTNADHQDRLVNFLKPGTCK